MALSKRKNDIKFFNLDTGEVVCTFNQCLHKFTEVGSHSITRTPVIDKDDDDKFIRTEVVSESYYHQCSECGRKVSDKADKSKSYQDYQRNKMRQIHSSKKKLIK